MTNSSQKFQVELDQYCLTYLPSKVVANVTTNTKSTEVQAYTKTAPTGYKVSFEVSSVSSDRLSTFFNWIASQTQAGTGVTLTATDNGGKKTTLYIGNAPAGYLDGDGPQKLTKVSVEKVTPDDRTWANSR